MLLILLIVKQALLFEMSSTKNHAMLNSNTIDETNPLRVLPKTLIAEFKWFQHKQK